MMISSMRVELSLAFELRSLGYTPAMLATSSGDQQSAGASAAGEAPPPSQSQSADHSGANASHSAATSTPPADSSNAEMTKEPPGTLVDGPREVPEGEEHRLHVHIDSALHLKFAASSGDPQQRALYVSWGSVSMHASPLALAGGDSEGGEASASWRYSSDHPCEEDAAACGDITFQVSARGVMSSTVDTTRQAQPEPGDAVLGVATVDMSPLSRLGEIRGWYNILDGERRTVGQLKVAVSLPGRFQSPPVERPALSQPSTAQPSLSEGDSGCTKALVSDNGVGGSVGLGAVPLEADRRLDELPPGWRAAGVLQQRDSDSTVDLKAALRSNLQELDVMMTHIKPPLSLADACSPGAASGSPTSNTAAVVDTFAGLSLYPQPGGGFSEHLGLPEAESSSAADASHGGADADRWDSIEQELWVDPGILSIIGDSHPVPSTSYSKASEVQADRERVAAKPNYSVLDELSDGDLQPGPLSAAARESQDTMLSHADELLATHGMLLGQSALYDYSAAGNGSVPGYSSFSDYAFGIGVHDAPFAGASPAVSAGEMTQKESGGLSWAGIEQTLHTGRSPEYSNGGIGSEAGQEGGQLLTCSDDENYMVSTFEPAASL